MAAEGAQLGDVESPCIGVCRMGVDGYCEGCLRTLEEIARWGEMNAAERLTVFRAAAARARRATS